MRVALSFLTTPVRIASALLMMVVAGQWIQLHTLCSNVHWTACGRQNDKNKARRTSLMAQWLRIHLLMQGTRVRALVWEDPTCHRATKPVCHN